MNKAFEGYNLNTRYNTEQKIRKVLARTFMYLFLIAIAATAFFPFYTMVIFFDP